MIFLYRLPQQELYKDKLRQLRETRQSLEQNRARFASVGGYTQISLLHTLFAMRNRIIYRIKIAYHLIFTSKLKYFKGQENNYKNMLFKNTNLSSYEVIHLLNILKIILIS